MIKKLCLGKKDNLNFELPVLKTKGKGYGSNICLTTHPNPEKQIISAQPLSFLTRFDVYFFIKKIDVLKCFCRVWSSCIGCDGFVVRFPCLFCSHNKTPTQTIQKVSRDFHVEKITVKPHTKIIYEFIYHQLHIKTSDI